MMDYNGTAYDKLQDERLEMLKKLLASLKLDCTEDTENPEHDKVILSYIDPETNEIKKTEATLSIDRVLTSAYFDDEYNFLHLEFNCYEKDPETGEPIKKDLVIPFPGLTFAYKKGDGIFISEPAIIDPEDPDAKYKNKTISLQINQEAEDSQFINLTAEGLGLSGITTAFTDADNNLSAELTNAYKEADNEIISGYQEADEQLRTELTEAYTEKDSELSDKIDKLSDNLINLKGVSGVQRNGNEFSIKVLDPAINDNKFINLTSGGLGLSGITSAFTEADNVLKNDIANLSENFNNLTGVSGVLRNGKEFSINVAPLKSNKDNKFINLTSDGLGLSGITEAFTIADNNLRDELSSAINETTNKLQNEINARKNADTQLSSEISGLTERTLTRDRWLHDKITGNFDTLTGYLSGVYSKLDNKIGTLTGVSGVQRDGNKFFINVASPIINDNKFINLTSDGLGLSGITTFVNSVSSNIVKDYQAKDITLSSNLIDVINNISGNITSNYQAKDTDLEDKIASISGKISGNLNLVNILDENSDINYYARYQLKYGDTPIGTTIDIPKDQFLKSAAYIPAEEVLRLTFQLNVESGETNSVDIPVGDLIDEYSEGNGITITDNIEGKNIVSINVASSESEDNKFINLTSGGLGLSGITDFVNSVSEQLQTNINKVETAYNDADKELSDAYKAADETLSNNLLGTIDGLNSRFTLSGDHNNSEYASIYTLLYDGKQIGDPINIPKDQFLKSAEYIPSAEVLRFEFELSNNNSKTLDIPVSALIDEYSEGNGITITDQVDGKNIVSINVASSESEDNKFINLTSEGLGLSGITEAYKNADNNLHDELTDAYIAADNNLRSELTNAYITADNNLHDELTDAYIAADNNLRSELTNAYTTADNEIISDYQEADKALRINIDNLIDNDKFLSGTLKTVSSTITSSYKDADTELKTQLTEDINDKVNALTGIFGVQRVNNNFSIKVSDQTINDNKFINLTSGGLGLAGITTAFTDADNTLSATLSSAVIGYVKDQFDALTGVSGITYNNKQISINVADSGTNDNKFINLTSGGLGLAGITDFVNSVSSNIVTGYQAKDTDLENKITNISGNLTNLTGVSGVLRNDNKFSINVAPSGTNDNKFINLTSDGLGLAGITTFVNSVSEQLQTNINKVETAYKEADKKLNEQIVSEYKAADETLRGQLTGYVKEQFDALTGVNGITYNKDNKQISIKFNESEDNKFINLTSEGLGLSGITTAFTDADNNLSATLSSTVTGYVDVVSSNIVSAYQSADNTLSATLSSAVIEYVKDQFDSLTGVNGITYNTDNKQISIKVADPSETNDNKFINLTDSGLGLAGITDAFTTADNNLYDKLTNAYKDADNTLSSTLSAAVTEFVNEQKFLKEIEVSGAEALSITEKANNEQTISLAISNQPGNAIVDAASGLFVQKYVAGENITLSANANGEMTINGSNSYELPPATSGAFGGIKSGKDIEIDSDGFVTVLSAASAVCIKNSLIIGDKEFNGTSSVEINVTSGLNDFNNVNITSGNLITVRCC